MRPRNSRSVRPAVSGCTGTRPPRVDRWAVAALVVRVFEDKLAALQDQAAAQGDALAGLTPDPRHAVSQPDGVDAAGRVADGRAQLLQPARQVFDLEPLQGADNGAFGLEEQLGDRRRWWEGLMAQREVEQQIADGMDAQAGVQPRADGADALE